MDKTRIIVVEDNIVYCEFVCNLLAREGFRTVQAYHLSTAKKLLQQASDGDIVVSDLRLPDGDGIDLLRWMRKEGMTQPLIIMTNYAEVHTAVESMKLGSLDYIPKQLVEDKLMPLLHTILKERSIGRNRMPVFARDSSAFQKIMQLSRPEKGLQKRVNLMQQTTNSDLSRHYLPRQLRSCPALLVKKPVNYYPRTKPFGGAWKRLYYVWKAMRSWEISFRKNTVSTY